MLERHAACHRRVDAGCDPAPSAAARSSASARRIAGSMATVVVFGAVAERRRTNRGRARGDDRGKHAQRVSCSTAPRISACVDTVSSRHALVHDKDARLSSREQQRRRGAGAPGSDDDDIGNFVAMYDYFVLTAMSIFTCRLVSASKTAERAVDCATISRSFSAGASPSMSST